MNIRIFRGLMPAASVAALAAAFAAEAHAATSVQFQQATYSVNETGPSVQVQLTRTGDAAAFSVTLGLSGSATAGSDYTAPATTVTWASGDTTKTITIPIIDDSVAEGTGQETIQLQLSNPTAGVTLGSLSSATVTIVDNDTAVQFSQASYTVAEQNGSAQVYITRVGAPAAFSVPLNVVVGISTATGSGTDYTAPASSVSWTTGETTKMVSIPLNDDTLINEGDETIQLQLGTPTNSVALGSPSTATVTIQDNDVAVQFATTSYTVGEGGGSVQIQLSRAGSSTALTASSTNLTITGGSATVGVDYFAPTTVTWAAGATTATATITLIEDTLTEAEPDETIVLGLPLAQPLGVNVVAPLSATVTITDNDGGPAITTQPEASSVTFGDSITLSATFSGATNADTTYTWMRGEQVLVEGGRYSIAPVSIPTNSNTASSTLTISDAKSVDAGDYKLVVSNTVGTAQSVETTPVAVTVAQASTTRDPATLSLSATGAPSAFLTLPNGSTLVAIGGNGTVNGASGSSSNSRLVLVAPDGSVSATGAGVFNGAVSALHLLDDGNILVSGSFTLIGGQGGAGRVGLARLTWSGNSLVVDAAFAPSPVPTVGATRIVTDAVGRIYLGGAFTAFAGQTGYDYLVRLYPDGSLDRNFVLNPLPQAGGSVNVLARQTDGKILVAGSFAKLAADSLPVTGVYRLNADGSYDTSFAPPVPSGGSTRYNAAAFDSQDRILLAGGGRVLRLLASGAVDTSYQFSDTHNFSANGLLNLKGDKLLVVGNFTTLTPATGASTTVGRILRLNADGSKDTAYNDNSNTGEGVGSGLNNEVLAAYLAPTGRVWLGGAFTSYKGETATRIAVLQGDAPEADFTLAPTGRLVGVGETVVFNALGTGDNGASYHWSKGGAPLSDGTGIAGSATATLTLSNVALASSDSYSVTITTSTGKTSTKTFILGVTDRLEVNASPVDLVRDLGASATFEADIRLGSTVVPFGGPVSYQWYRDGVLVNNGAGVSGANTPVLTIDNLVAAQAGFYHLRAQYGSSSVESDVASLTLERRPAEVATTMPTLTAGDDVSVIRRLADNSMLVGGSFGYVIVDGVQITRSRIMRFLPDGTLDTSFNPTFNNAVTAIVQGSDGKIYVSGVFTSVNFGSGNVARRRVLRLNADYTLDTTFDTSASGPDGAVNALAVDASGGVYIGGTFTNRLARLTATGAVDPTFVSGATADVNALLLSGSSLYVGGASDTWATGSGSARLVKLNATTGAREAFTSPATTVTIYGLRMAGGDILANGANGTGPYLERLDATGSVSRSYASEIADHSNPVRSVHILANGSLLVGSRNVLSNIPINGEDISEYKIQFHTFGSWLYALAEDVTNRIWAGGSFVSYDGSSANANRLAVLAGGAASSSTGTKQAQAIDFPALSAIEFGQAAPVLGATAPGGAVSYELVSGPATLSGGALTIGGTGTVVVRATQAGGPSYAAAVPVTRSFTVSRATQTITFPNVAAKSKYAPAFLLDAASDQDLALTYETNRPDLISINPATGEVSIITAAINANATVSVTISQAGNTNVAAAVPVTRSFEIRNVTLKAQAINFPQPAARVFGSSPKTIAASTSSRLPLTFAIHTDDVAADIAEFDPPGSSTLKINAAGSVRIVVSQPGDNLTYEPAVSVERTLVINKATHSIGFVVPAKVTLGDDPLTLSATAGAGLVEPVVFEVVGGNAATLEDGVLTFIQPGTVKVKASHPGDDNFLPAKDVIRTITVTNPQINFVKESMTALYDGEVHAAEVTGVPPAFIDDVVITYQLGSTAPTTDAPINAGTYRVLATFGDLRRIGSLVIKKVPLIVTPLDKTAKVGTDIVPSLFELRYDGFIGDEGVEVFGSSLPFATSSANKNSAAGAYPIRVTGGSATNYQLVYNNSKKGLVIGGTSVFPGTLTLVGLGGGYEALVLDSETGATVGHLALTMLNNSYGYTGTLSLGVESAPIAIRSVKTGTSNLELTPDEEGTTATGVWERSTGASLSVNMTVTGGGLSGALTRDGTTYVIEGRRLAAASTLPVETYTLRVAPSGEDGMPMGAGYATGSISRTGLLKLTGLLGDGATLTASLKRGDDGNYRYFGKPYGAAASRFNGTRGSYAGGLFSPNFEAAQEVELTWSKLGLGTAETTYQDGFGPTIVAARLNPWVKPDTNNSLGVLLGLGEGEQPFVVDFDAEFTTEQLVNLESLTTRTLLATGAVKAVPTAENPTAFAMRLVPATGVFTGSFRVVVAPDFVRTRVVSFSGILHQGEEDSLIGSGYFLLPGTTTSGEIRFELPVVEEEPTAP